MTDEEVETEIVLPAPVELQQGRERVLVVEDERIVAIDLQNTLERLGYAVAGVASRGEDALRLSVDEFARRAALFLCWW